jgi:Flp pilus assembly protein TadG
MKRVGEKGSSSTGERGSALVELAMLLPLLTIMILGVIDLGLVIAEHQIIQNAAREGSRFSILPANNKLNKTTAQQTQIDADIEARVTSYAAGERITINPANITINQSFPVPNANGTTEHGSQVVVLYTRTLLFPRAPFATVTLKAEAVFQNLYAN